MTSRTKQHCKNAAFLLTIAVMFIGTHAVMFISNGGSWEKLAILMSLFIVEAAFLAFLTGMIAVFFCCIFDWWDGKSAASTDQEVS